MPVERLSFSSSMAATMVASSTKTTDESRPKAQMPSVSIAIEVLRFYSLNRNSSGKSLLAVIQAGFSTRKLPSTRLSISLFEKVLKAFAGVVTIGSPRRLKEVFNTTGTPVAWPKRSISP